MGSIDYGSGRGLVEVEGVTGEEDAATGGRIYGGGADLRRTVG